jgi:hypothetical protein
MGAEFSPAELCSFGSVSFLPLDPRGTFPGDFGQVANVRRFKDLGDVFIPGLVGDDTIQGECVDRLLG